MENNYTICVDSLDAIFMKMRHLPYVCSVALLLHVLYNNLYYYKKIKTFL